MRSLLTYLASLHQVLEQGKAGGVRGEEGDSGVSSSSSGQASPVGVGVVRRRRGEERREKEEVRRRVRSLCEGEGESAFLSAFRKFSSLTLSQGEVGWDGGRGGDKREFKAMEEKDDVSLKRLGVRMELKREPTKKRESVSRGCQTEDRGCQTEESHLRSKHLWKRQPLSVKFAPSPPLSIPSLPQSVQPSNPIPTPSSDSIFYSSSSPPAPPQKQRMSMRLAQIEAVRRRQSASHLSFSSHQSGSHLLFNSHQSGSHLNFNSHESGSHSHIPFNSLPFPPPPLHPYHQFSTLV